MNRKDSARLLGVNVRTFDRLRKTPGFPQARRMPALKRGAPSWNPDELKRWHASLPLYVEEPHSQIQPHT